MNRYVAFWMGHYTEVYADTAYKAQQASAEIFGKRCKRWDVTVVVAEIAGKPVTHSTNSL